MIRFGRYQLDRQQGLRCGTREVRITPKSLSVLCTLAERAGEVVTKEELFRAVWPEITVSDSTLTSCIQELRSALGDNSRQPQFIQTLHRRGYRFLGRTSPAAEMRSSERTQFVGRESVLDEMLSAYVGAERGERQIIFVTGEAGIGKTTVVEAFLSSLVARYAVRTTYSQCIQYYGAGEPYQPLLEALTRLCRQPGGDSLVPVLERYSPTWLAQLPALLTPERLLTIQRTSAGTTRTRMLRELNDVLEAISAEMPLVLWLEDLHWSDTSTLDWIASFGQRREPARILLIGTFRPGVESEHPPSAVSDALRIKRFCREIALDRWDETAVAGYTALRFPSAPDDSDSLRRLARMVHRRTGGNPLFVTNVLADLIARRLLTEYEGRWAARPDLNELDLEIPDDVRRMIEQQLNRLVLAERAILEIAAVAGERFSASAIAAAAGEKPAQIEATLAALARRHQFVREAGVSERPDGTIAARFDFLHVLYRDVLYQHVPPSRRAELHLQIGAHEEATYGDRASEIAAELAMHFETGRDLSRAATYFQFAAANAQSRGAYPEARAHFERALGLLESDCPGQQRNERELELRIGLGAVTMALRGWGAPEVEQTYSQARVLAQKPGNTPRIFPALWGLWLFYWGRGPVSTADQLAEDLLSLARKAGDSSLSLQAHHAGWATAFLRGDFDSVHSHAAEGNDIYELKEHAPMSATYGSHDAGVCCGNFLAWRDAMAGWTDKAARESDAAVALARELRHPMSLALAHVFAACTHQVRCDPVAVRTHASAAVAIARNEDFRLLLAWASQLAGWAAVEQGQYQDGIAQIERGLTDCRATANNSFLTYYLGLYAEAQLKSGRAVAGLHSIHEAFALMESTGERFWEPELHRLRGELQLAAGVPSANGSAEEAFLKAIRIARSQGAHLLVLRGTVSLSRLWRRLGRHAEVRQLIAEVRNGAATLRDTVEARVS